MHSAGGGSADLAIGLVKMRGSMWPAWFDDGLRVLFGGFLLGFFGHTQDTLFSKNRPQPAELSALSLRRYGTVYAREGPGPGKSVKIIENLGKSVKITENQRKSMKI